MTRSSSNSEIRICTRRFNHDAHIL